MTTLDRKKPFGEILGNHKGARFEQDGKLFDHEGKEVGGSKPEPVPNPEPPAKAAKTKRTKRTKNAR